MPESIELLIALLGAIFLLAGVFSGIEVEALGIAIPDFDSSPLLRAALIALGVAFLILAVWLDSRNRSNGQTAETATGASSQSGIPRRAWLFPLSLRRYVTPKLIRHTVLSLAVLVMILLSPKLISAVGDFVNSVTEKPKEYFSDVDVPEGEVIFRGSTASAAMLCAPMGDLDPGSKGIHARIQKAHPDFDLTYYSFENEKEGNRPTSGEGLDLLIDDKIDFAFSSRPLNESEKKGGKVLNGKRFKLQEEKIAEYPLAFSVHLTAGISSLAEGELIRIFGNPDQLQEDRLDGVLGKVKSAITNWQAVGGANRDVVLYVHSAESNTDASYDFQTEILRGIAFGKVVWVENTTTGLLMVANPDHTVPNAPLGIYRAPAPLSFGQDTDKIRTIAILDDTGTPQLPYVSRQSPYKPDEVMYIHPYSNCADLEEAYPNSDPSASDDTNPNYHKGLWESLFVVYKDYDEDYDEDSMFRERAGKAYADLMLTNQGQNLLRFVGFKGVREE